MYFNFIDVYFVFLFIRFSIAIHPNKLVVATGQVCGTDRRDAMVNM